MPGPYWSNADADKDGAGGTVAVGPYWSNSDVAGGDPFQYVQWSDLATSDFATGNLAPTYDPNSVSSGGGRGLTDLGGGRFQWVSGEAGVTTASGTTGTLWRLDWPADYEGTGTRGMIFKITPETALTSLGPRLGFLFADRGADPHAAGANGIGFAIGANTSGGVGLYYGAAYNLSGAPGAVIAGTTGRAIAASPLLHCAWDTIAGRPGDMTNVGVQPGFPGVLQYGIRSAGPVTENYNITWPPSVTDGYGLLLAGGWATAGAVNTWTAIFRIQWAVVPLWPTGTWSP